MREWSALLPREKACSAGQAAGAEALGPRLGQALGYILDVDSLICLSQQPVDPGSVVMPTALKKRPKLSEAPLCPRGLLGGAGGGGMGAPHSAARAMPLTTLPSCPPRSPVETPFIHSFILLYGFFKIGVNIT